MDSLTEEINEDVLMFTIRIDSGALIWSFHQVVICHLVSRSASEGRVSHSEGRGCRVALSLIHLISVCLHG